MAARISHPRQTLTVLGAAAVLLVGAIVATNGHSTRASVLAALQRPATMLNPPLGKTMLLGRVHRGAVSVVVRATPNRTSARNKLSVSLTAGRRPLEGAAVTVSFSMPSMNMWGGLTNHLISAGGGTYVADEPVLGMPGRWQLRVQVKPIAAHPFAVVIGDLMRS